MKILYTLGLLLLSVQMWAVPARSYFFRALMSDGTYQNIRLCGDENFHYYVNEDGYVVERETDSTYTVTNMLPSELARNTVGTRASIGSTTDAAIQATGNPKIPVILVNFNDLKFSLADTDEELVEYYDLYCNGTQDGVLYTGAGSKGSVRDYFVQQSDSTFFPEFVVIGPVTLEKDMAYYGQNSSSGSQDIHFTEFRNEVLAAAVSLMEDFETQFDNDGNGTVDLAFIIYAGVPESDTGASEDAIWPKEVLSQTTVNGVKIDVTGCCSELSTISGNEVAAGIGTMCHEVAHSLGLPDEYDVNYVELGMSYWSLMDTGNYCNNSRTPCGLTAYERDMLGWRTCETLTESTTVILHPLEDGGVGYKVVNDANSDEYYVLENRQKVGWDSSLATLGHGMLVVHVDYSATAWRNNKLNVDGDHQRMTFIPANNVYVGQYNATSSSHLRESLAGQPYPGTSENTSLTDETTPAAEVFTGDFMGKPITQIKELDNGDIVFKFMPKGVLDAPAVHEAENLTSQSFSLSWDAAENASCYSVEVYTVSEGEVSDELVYSADSLSATECEVVLESAAGQSLACRVMAMDDAYEDSPYSDYVYVTLETDAISSTVVEADDRVEVYSLGGVLMAKSKEAMANLPRGVYVMRAEGKTVKIVIN